MDKKFDNDRQEPEIVYSRAVKAGKRIYYLDVKKARNEDLYLCITESKKESTAEGEMPVIKKHRVFLYKEDFANFTEGLNDVISYVQGQFGEIEQRRPYEPEAEMVDPHFDEATEEDRTEKKGLFARLRKDKER